MKEYIIIYNGMMIDRNSYSSLPMLALDIIAHGYSNEKSASEWCKYLNAKYETTLYAVCRYIRNTAEFLAL